MKRLERYMQDNYPSSDYTILYPPQEAYAGYPDEPTIVFEGSITDGVLTVSNVTSGSIEAGMSVVFPGVKPGTEIAFPFQELAGLEHTSYQKRSKRLVRKCQATFWTCMPVLFSYYWIITPVLAVWEI